MASVYMAGRQYLIWHPSVHATFRDELIFFLLTVNAFPKDGVYDELEEFLGNTGHTSYRIYRVFGTFDIILRVWVEKGHADTFSRELVRTLDYVTDATPVVVEDIPHHWYYKEKTPTESISRLTPEQVKPIQERFSKKDTWSEDPVRSALRDNLVRIVEEIDEAIMFFTGITHTDVRALETKTLLQEIYALFGQFGEIDKTVVYLTRGRYAILIKCEAQNFFQIGAFISELSHRIAVNRCGTVTSVVADPRIRGSEKIGKRSFDQIARRDIPTYVILPEVYENESMSARERKLIESWIGEHLVPNRDDMTEQEFKGVQTCLRAVVDDDEKQFLSTIVQMYGPIERELRRLEGPFIGKMMGAGNVKATVRAALGHKPNPEAKDLKLLSLGDRLDVYAYVIKEKELSTEKDVTGSWNQEVQLRDEAAHFYEAVFPKWHQNLSVLLRFLRRYKKLLKVVEPLHD